MCKGFSVFFFLGLLFHRHESGGGVQVLKNLIVDGGVGGRMLVELSVRGLQLTCASMLQV
jgi:hypothetical protein